MNRSLNKTFDKEVNRYRNSLLFFAKKCDWEAFKSNAGNLFDYIESVEMQEIERKFFRIFKIILGVLFFAVFFIISINPETNAEMSRTREIMIIAALAGCCYELYFFISLRFYMKHKMNFHKKRRERFIFNIQGDFRDVIVPSIVEQVREAPQASAEPAQVLQNAF